MKQTVEEISLCPNCNCMTKTINGNCGKCGISKNTVEERFRKSINYFAEKFIVVKGCHLIFRSSFGEFEKWLDKTIKQETKTSEIAGYSKGMTEGYLKGTENGVRSAKKFLKQELSLQEKTICEKCEFYQLKKQSYLK